MKLWPHVHKGMWSPSWFDNLLWQTWHHFTAVDITCWHNSSPSWKSCRYHSAVFCKITRYEVSMTGCDFFKGKEHDIMKGYKVSHNFSAWGLLFFGWQSLHLAIKLKPSVKPILGIFIMILWPSTHSHTCMHHLTDRKSTCMYNIYLKNNMASTETNQIFCLAGRHHASRAFILKPIKPQLK